MNASAPRCDVMVRGGGSIGTRHARLAAELGLTVGLWPVRPGPRTLPPGVGLVQDSDAAALCAAARLVVVATDTGRHVSDTLAVLDAGAAKVLVEKPLAASAIQASPLRPWVETDTVFVAAPLRGMTGFRDLCLRASGVGQNPSLLVTCQSWLPDWRPDSDYRQSYSARADEGGVLRDLVHELDCALVLGGPAALQGAHLQRGGPLEMDAEQAATLIWTAPRAHVLMRLDYITRPGDRRYVLSGPGGRVEWDVRAATVTTWDADGRCETIKTDEDRDAGMRRQLKWLLTGEGEWARPATLGEGFAVMELCDEARAR